MQRNKHLLKKKGNVVKFKSDLKREYMLNVSV